MRPHRPGQPRGAEWILRVVVALAASCFLGTSSSASGEADEPDSCATEWTVEYWTGSPGGAGIRDDTGTKARFRSPGGLACDSSGVWVTDSENHEIRHVTPSGVVTTFAGVSDQYGTVDGVRHEARLTQPTGIALLPDGRLVFTDPRDDVIRVATRDGHVWTLAGQPGERGWIDAAGSSARFAGPLQVAVESSGALIVADSRNHCIRRVWLDGRTETVAGAPDRPGGDDGPVETASFYIPNGVALGADGSIFVSENNCTIRQILPSGTVCTVAGAFRQQGNADGPALEARFITPRALFSEPDGTLWILDNTSVRKLKDGVVSTVSGDPGYMGYLDGDGSTARWGFVSGICRLRGGPLAVSDSYNDCIRTVSDSGQTSTLAGLGVQRGHADGAATETRFSDANGVDFVDSTTLVVADTGNSVIRRISGDGSSETLSGAPGVCGWADYSHPGLLCRPYDVAVSPTGSIYIADFGTSTVRKLLPEGVLTTVAGYRFVPGAVDGQGETARFRGLAGIDVAADDTLIVADTNNYTLRIIDPFGNVSTVAGLAGVSGTTDGHGSAARFLMPWGCEFHRDGGVMSSDKLADTIRKMGDDGYVATIAGKAGASGSSSGRGEDARFNAPLGIAVDDCGNTYVADFYNDVVRRVDSSGFSRDILGLPLSPGAQDGTGDGARLFRPTYVAWTPPNTLAIVEQAARIRIARPAIPDRASLDDSIGTVGSERRLGVANKTGTDFRWSLFRRQTGSRAEIVPLEGGDATFRPDLPGLYIFELRASDGTGVRISRISLEVVGEMPPTDLSDAGKVVR